MDLEYMEPIKSNLGEEFDKQEENDFFKDDNNKPNFENKENQIEDFRNFVEGRKLKMQNFYVLFFLRNLFFFDPEKFQGALIEFFTTKKVDENTDNINDFCKVNIENNKFDNKDNINFNSENEESFFNNDLNKNVSFRKFESIRSNFKKFDSLKNNVNNNINNNNNINICSNNGNVNKNFLRKMTKISNLKHSKKTTEKSIIKIGINNHNNNFNYNNSLKNKNLETMNSKNFRYQPNEKDSEFGDSDSEMEYSIYYHDPEESFELDKEKINYFFSIINKYFIFGNFLCEAGKLFELCNERTLIRSNFIYDLLITNIFLMQNICEGHNSVMQELMFDMRLKPIYNETFAKNIDLSCMNLEQQMLQESRDGVSNMRDCYLNRQNEIKNKTPNIPNNNNKNKNKKNKKKKNIHDKERKKIEKFLEQRSDFEFSYINFLSNLMRNIVFRLYFDFDNRYVFINKTFALNSNFICVYSKITDLIIEMIQGTHEHNLYNFYVPRRKKENQIIPSSENINQIRDFQFLIFLYDIKQVFLKDGDDPEKEFSSIKTLTFSILNNILNQENVNIDFIKMLLKIFGVEFLMSKMTLYMKKLVLCFQQGIMYEHPQFPQLVNKINLANFCFEDFYKIFLSHEELPEDDYFLLCVQMFYYINITGDKFLMQESVDILELDDKKSHFTSKGKTNVSQSEADSNAKIIRSTVIHSELEIENTIFLKSNKLENKLKIFFEKTLKKTVNTTGNINNNLAEKIIKQNNVLKNDVTNNINNNNNYINVYHKVQSSIQSGDSKRSLVRQNSNANGNENLAHAHLNNVIGNKNNINNNYNGSEMPNFREILNLNANKSKKNIKNNKDNNEKLKVRKKNFNNDYLKQENLENKEVIKAENNFNSYSKENRNEPNLEKNTPLEDILYTKQFYSKIVNSVEFVIDDEHGRSVKEIYFIKNPTGFLINETNIKNFFKKADRKDATTKITSLLDSIENFLIEIDYQLNINNKFKRYLLKYDYKMTDFISFILSVIINLILLFSLTEVNIDDSSLNEPIFKSVRGFGITQIFINLLSLIMFLIIKQKFWITYELNRIRKTEFSYMGNSIVENEIILSKISLCRKLKFYIIDCFLFNEEVILINFNIVLGLIGISHFYATMIFSMQLLTVVRFVETIRDILEAFRSKFDQLIAMVFFMLFLIYFYTNVAYFFLNAEYNGRGVGHTSERKEDTCRSLFRCFIYHFNEGVRSGGGIGDHLEIKSWDSLPLFFGRWILDMVFFISVLLLLLNMINGIIVSTFSAIREESEQKADDKENRCFICSIDKAEFEKKKVSFKTHLKKEHNVKDYINFIIFLKMTPNKNLDSNQGFIKKSIEDRDINVFPIYQSKALGPGIFDRKDED